MKAVFHSPFQIYPQQFVRTQKTMKQGFKVTQSKHPQYQDYRKKARSELDCSGLLSGINELDLKMKEYEQLKRNKSSLSQSDIECSSPLKENQSLCQVSRQKLPTKVFDNKTDRLMGCNLETILQHNNPRTKTMKFSNPISSSAIMGQTCKTGKALLTKTVNTNPKEDDGRKEKIKTLRLKTKQLHQELLEALGSDSSKKNTLNKEFAILFKLLE